jgi:threonine dehydratase
MYESVKVGRPLSMPEEDTMAEALSGGIGLSNRFTLPLVRHLVDDHILVEEEEIREAMLYASSSLHTLLEGGGAVALAAVLARKCHLPAERDSEATAVVLSGGNVSLDRLRGLAAPH